MGTNDTMAEANVPPAIKLFYRAIAHKDIEILRIAVTLDWEYIPAQGSVFADLVSALPDMQIEIQDILVHDKMVAVRARVTGTQSGPIMGIAATLKQVNFAIHSFHELRDGKIAKTWHLEDWLTVFRQLGELPPISS